MSSIASNKSGGLAATTTAEGRVAVAAAESLLGQLSSPDSTYSSVRGSPLEHQQSQPQRAPLSRRFSSVGNFIDFTQTTHEESGTTKEGRYNTSVLLDISIDRRVEVAALAQAQWKSRNVPNVSGLVCTISARQDLELLYFDILITLPRKGPRRARHEGSLEDFD